jgi:H2-forming N5,N10-methylenetetrahydromethanopterin dehydrogenase-like enzyme
MPTNIDYVVENLTKEEYEIAMDAVQKLREEKKKRELEQTAVMLLEGMITTLVNLIGVNNTRRLLKRAVLNLHE